MTPQHNDGDHVEVRIPRFENHGAAPPAFKPAPAKAPTAKPADSSYGTPALRDWYFFTLELRTALESGVGFIQALELVSRNSHSRGIRQAVLQVLQRLKENQSIATALAEARQIPAVVRNLLLVGLRGGNMSAMMEQMTAHYSWLLEMRGRILKAIAYPSMMVILGLLVFIGRDVAISTMTGGDTSAAVARALGRYALFPALAAALAVLCAWLISTPLLRGWFDHVVLTAPLIGKLIRKYCLAVFLRVYALLQEAGLPVTQGWLLAIQSVPNAHIAQQLHRGLHFLQDGESLPAAMKQTGLFGGDALMMAATGSSTGSSAFSLQKYAHFEEQEMKLTVRMLLTFVYPICLFLLAVGYFISIWALVALAFLLVFARRVI